MDQIKIGKFIQEKRKEKNLTQSDIAEKLNISDRSVSKWESGKSLPDISNMIELSKILSITINELLSGEVVDNKNTTKKLEENLITITKLKEEKDRQLAKLEIIIGYISSISFITLLSISSLIKTSLHIKIIISIIAFIIFIIGTQSTIKIEKEVGYYKCNKCDHKYIPEYKDIIFSFKFWNKRYLICPKCKQKSLNRKVVKDE